MAFLLPALVALAACDQTTWTADPGSMVPVDLGASDDTAIHEIVRPDAEVVVYAVRHTEKDSGDDPGLTEEGQARAEALAVRLAEVPLVAIYATDLRRTQDTVAPTAEDHGLDIVTDIDPEEELALHILTAHGGDNVLHAGHSYTLPGFWDALGVEDAYTLPTEYGDLWILTVAVTGEVTWVVERFGDE